MVCFVVWGRGWGFLRGINMKINVDINWLENGGFIFGVIWVVLDIGESGFWFFDGFVDIVG